MGKDSYHAIFRMPIDFNFNPQPDITAYELARLLPYLFGKMYIYEGEWETFDPALKKHLKKE